MIEGNLPKMSKQTGELDQVMNVYRQKLKTIGHLWTQLVHLGQCDVSLMTKADEIMEQLESSALTLAEEQVNMEMARHNVRNLKQMLAVSQQTLEAKSQHLGMVEQQKEEEQNLRLREFNKIHQIEAEKVDTENELKPMKEKMTRLVGKLTRKCEKLRHLEEFVASLTEQLHEDLIEVKVQTDEARTKRRTWDRFDVDVQQEVENFPLDMDQLKVLEASVMEMKEALQNQMNWYEEELKTKLYYSSRNKEMQNKIGFLKTAVKRMERSGRYEDKDDGSEKTWSLSQKSEGVLIDGLPDIQAKDVEEFLSHQFGVRVLADYTMLRRLKEDIGVVGLAYLVERIRLQGSHQGNTGPCANRTFKDMEERQIEMALQTIAMEYRAQEETRRRSCISIHATPLTDDFKDGLSTSTNSPRLSGQRLRVDRFLQSPSSMSSGSGMDHNLDNSDVILHSGTSSRRGSTSSLKSKSSLSRLKKIFKF